MIYCYDWTLLSQDHGIRLGANNENDGGYDKNGKLSAAPLLVAKQDPAVKFKFPDVNLGKLDSQEVIALRGKTLCFV